jgi:hypothetical protein
LPFLANRLVSPPTSPANRGRLDATPRPR